MSSFSSVPVVLDRLRHSDTVDEITQGSEPARRVYAHLVDAVHRTGVSDEATMRDVLRRVHVYHAPSAALRDNARTVLHDVVDAADVAKAHAVLYEH